MGENIFQRRAVIKYGADIEFEDFKRQATTEIQPLTAENPRFQALADAYYFTTSLSVDQTLQCTFGKRKTGEIDVEDNEAIKSGATLLYMLESGGTVSTVLYPAKSSLGSTIEDMSFIRIGYYSAHQLLGKLQGDLKRLTAYGYVSSMHTDPTWGERFSIGWLRSFHPMRVDDKYQSPARNAWLGTAATFTARTLALVLLKPVFITLLILLLVFVGYHELADKFLGRSVGTIKPAVETTVTH